MAGENRLGRFIADLALSPETLRSYQADAEAAMTAAGLSGEEKAVLRRGDFRVICDFLQAAGRRPFPDPQPGGGGGSGGPPSG
jgi:hypothetical protein